MAKVCINFQSAALGVLGYPRSPNWIKRPKDNKYDSEGD